MNYRLLDALIMIAETARRSTDFAQESRDVSEKLLAQGFSQDEVEKSLKLVAERTTSKAVKRPVRVLSNFERVHMTTQGSGLLIKLRNLGLLTDEHIELIIARALILDELPIDEERVRSMAFMLLFDFRFHRDSFSMYLDFDDSEVEN